MLFFSPTGVWRALCVVRKGRECRGEKSGGEVGKEGRGLGNGTARRAPKAEWGS